MKRDLWDEETFRLSARYSICISAGLFGGLILDWRPIRPSNMEDLTSGELKALGAAYEVMNRHLAGRMHIIFTVVNKRESRGIGEHEQR